MQLYREACELGEVLNARQAVVGKVQNLHTMREIMRSAGRRAHVDVVGDGVANTDALGSAVVREVEDEMTVLVLLGRGHVRLLAGPVHRDKWARALAFYAKCKLRDSIGKSFFFCVHPHSAPPCSADDGSWQLREEEPSFIIADTYIQTFDLSHFFRGATLDGCRGGVSMPVCMMPA